MGDSWVHRPAVGLAGSNLGRGRQQSLPGVGPLLMSACTGYLFAGPRTPGNPAESGVGLSTAMLLFCLFTPTALASFRFRAVDQLIAANSGRGRDGNQFNW